MKAGLRHVTYPNPPGLGQIRLRLAWPALATLVLMSACATRQAQQIPASAVPCSDPRPEICTMDYTPVCATRDNGRRCLTLPCESTETATYSNACSACSDPRVIYHLPGECG